jgi:hypothetical protein
MKKKKQIFAAASALLIAMAAVSCSSGNRPVNDAETEISKDGTQLEEQVESKVEELKLDRTYTTKFSEVNAITYPQFLFDYPSRNWEVSQEEVTQETEFVTLKNSRGVEIKYAYFGFPKDFQFGTSTVSMLRVDVSKAAESRFIPGYVQATDYSDLGSFIVAKLKVTGELDMQNDSAFSNVDGSVSYAVLPQSSVGTRDDVRGPFIGEFSFWYGGHVSFTCSAPDGKFSKEEEQEILKILNSFRIKE